jgi:hypothetical protein
MDRWVTFAEVNAKLRKRQKDGLKYNYVKCCLGRAVDAGYILERDTGIRKAYKYDPIFIVYEYIRVVTGRPTTRIPFNALKPQQRKKKSAKKRAMPKVKKIFKSEKRKLTDDHVRQIRFMYAAGETTLDKLSKMYRVSIPVIHGIVKRKHYREVRDF